MTFAVLALLLLPVLQADSPPSGQSFLSCSALFSNSVNGKPLVSPAIAAYSSYSGLVSTALLVVAMMFIVVGLIYGLGIAFRWDMLKNFAKTEYLEGFVSILIIVFVAGGIAAFSGALGFIGGLFSVGTGTTIPGSFQTLYGSLCTNIFNKMIIPGVLVYVWIFINKLFFSIITALTIDLAPGGFGVTLQPLFGFGLVNQLLWIEDGLATFMLAAGGMLIVMLFVIYYLFPIFLFLGIALRTFPWTRAAGGAFIALFIAFYIFFPAIMYPFTVSYSSTTNPSSSALGLCSSNSCPTGIGIALGSLKAYLGVLTLDVGYTAYTNLLYFSEIFLYLGINLLGLLISLLISYELVETFGRLLGAPSVKGRGLFKKIFK